MMVEKSRYSGIWNLHQCSSVMILPSGEYLYTSVAPNGFYYFFLFFLLCRSTFVLFSFTVKSTIIVVTLIRVSSSRDCSSKVTAAAAAAVIETQHLTVKNKTKNFNRFSSLHKINGSYRYSGINAAYDAGNFVVRGPPGHAHSVIENIPRTNYAKPSRPGNARLSLDRRRENRGTID